MRAGLKSLWRVVAIVFVAALLFVALGGPRFSLRAAGWALVSDDPLQPADAIVVAIDADGAGVLEAADLVHSGVAPIVAVLAGPSEAADFEFLRRGLPGEDEAARAVRQLRQLGVEQVVRITGTAAGTQDEGSVIPAWCDRQQLHSIVIVSSTDHTRRLRRVMHRAMHDRSTRVIVRRSRYSEFNPEQWWHTRAGVRTEVVELQKLLLDYVSHPFS